MKKNVFLIALIAIVVFVSSCSDEQQFPVNQSLIRDQLSQIPVPTAQEIQGKLSAFGPQKVKSEEFISYRVLPLDKQYFEVTETSATRYLKMYGIADRGGLIRDIQVKQIFSIKDGVLDTTSWSGHVDLEGIGIRRCTFWFTEHITSTTVFFRGDDGLQLAYNASLYDGAIYLPPLANGTWQVQVETFNKGTWQTFITVPYNIKKSDPDELFLLYDDILKISDPKENTVAIATVSAESLRGNFLFVCEDENGNCFSQPVPATINFEKITFAIPFNPRYIYIWGSNSQQTEIGPGIEPGSDGIYRYHL